MLSVDGAVIVSTHDVGLAEDLNFTLVRGMTDTDFSKNRTLFQ